MEVTWMEREERIILVSKCHNILISYSRSEQITHMLSVQLSHRK